MKKMRKIIGIFMALALVFTAAGFAAPAEASIVNEQVGTVDDFCEYAQGENDFYITLKNNIWLSNKALTVVAEHGTVNLNGYDIYMEESNITVADGSSLTLMVEETESRDTCGIHGWDKTMFIVGQETGGESAGAVLNIEGGSHYFEGDEPMIKCVGSTDDSWYTAPDKNNLTLCGYFITSGKAPIVEYTDSNRYFGIYVKSAVMETVSGNCIKGAEGCKTIIENASLYSEKNDAINLADTNSKFTVELNYMSGYGYPRYTAIDGKEYSSTAADYESIGSQKLVQSALDPWFNDISVHYQEGISEDCRVSVLNGSKGFCMASIYLKAEAPYDYSFAGWAKYENFDTDYMISRGAEYVADFGNNSTEDFYPVFEKKEMVDLSGFAWDYSAPLVYTGKTQKVTLTSLPEGLKAAYSGCSGTKVGTYHASANVQAAGELQYVENAVPALTWKIVPKKAAISSLSAGKASLTVNMSTKVGATGGSTYQVKYRVKGSSSWKTLTTTAKTRTIKNLKKGKTYQVKVRAYRTVDGQTCYGEFSAVKTAKVK